jgi:hypothetical protein
VRYHHHHGDAGDWILAGLGFAAGILIFRFVAGLIALAAMMVWYATGNLRPVPRKIVRGLFVVLLVSVLLVGAAVVLAE